MKKDSPFNDALQEVMANPDEWAKLMEGEATKMHGKAGNLRRKFKEGELPGTEDGEWRITVRRLPTEDGKAGVWVMYKKRAS